mgnify:CR=1 FL=1
MLDPLKDMVAWRTIENFPDNDWPIAQVNNFISLAQNIFLSFKVYRGNALSLERSDTIHFFPASSLLNPGCSEHSKDGHLYSRAILVLTHLYKLLPYQMEKMWH